MQILTKKRLWGNIDDMWWFIRKWWVLEQLRKYIRYWSRRDSRERNWHKGVLLTDELFIEGNDKYPGIAEKSVKRFSKILWRRRKIRDANKLIVSRDGLVYYRQFYQNTILHGLLLLSHCLWVLIHQHILRI